MYFITKNAKKKQYKEGGKLSSQSLVYRKKNQHVHCSTVWERLEKV